MVFPDAEKDHEISHELCRTFAGNRALPFEIESLFLNGAVSLTRSIHVGIMYLNRDDVPLYIGGFPLARGSEHSQREPNLFSCLLQSIRSAFIMRRSWRLSNPSSQHQFQFRAVAIRRLRRGAILQVGLH